MGISATEGAAPEPGVRAVIEDAFGRVAEADLVEALWRDGDLAISLVARCDGVLCGFAALSRLKSPPRSLALAPVAVLRSRQGRGVGSALVRLAIEIAAARGCASIFVLGDPAWYLRFRFSREAAAGYPSPYAGPHFMAVHLAAANAAAAPDAPPPVEYADAFARLG